MCEHERVLKSSSTESLVFILEDDLLPVIIHTKRGRQSSNIDQNKQEVPGLLVSVTAVAAPRTQRLTPSGGSRKVNCNY